MKREGGGGGEGEREKKQSEEEEEEDKKKRKTEIETSFEFFEKLAKPQFRNWIKCYIHIHTRSTSFKPNRERKKERNSLARAREQ